MFEDNMIQYVKNPMQSTKNTTEDNKLFGHIFRIQDQCKIHLCLYRTEKTIWKWKQGINSLKIATKRKKYIWIYEERGKCSIQWKLLNIVQKKRTSK